MVLPKFSQIDPKHFPEALKNKLDKNLKRVSDILESSQNYTWATIMDPLEDMEDDLERFWSPMAHLHAVVNSEALRHCYQACLPMLSAYESAIGQNQRLYQAIKSIDKNALDTVQYKIIEDTILDFELSGVALSAENKKRFEDIQTRLSKLCSVFENNILDSENAFSLQITDELRLKGLPEHARLSAQEAAQEKGLEGWLLTLQFPCYIAVMTYAVDRLLREEMYMAYVTRASAQGLGAEEYDNSPIINEILALRHEKANLLGFENYAKLSLAVKMAESTDQVLDFLTDLSSRTYQQGEVEFRDLQDFAAKNYKLETVAPWDIAYLSEKKKQKIYSFSEEDLRPYFPENKVIQGLFTIANKLYGIYLEEVKVSDIWHKDAKCFCVYDENQSPRGYILADFYSRTLKRGGAWMDILQSRRKLPNNTIQLPITTLTCNFARPTANKPATLSHEEVVTLFHEFGHCLHHVLSKVDYLAVSGVHGVEWDAVELPSQFFENWCWEKLALALLTAHVDTGEPLPMSFYEKLLAAKHYQSAMAMLRQVEFSLFDFRIHKEYREEKDFIQRILAEVREKTSVTPVTEYNRFANSFSHIFGGGYAAGYYSYKWAEVLSSDAFARFESEGIFNIHTGRDFLQTILEVGGSVKAMDAFVHFRGRKANIDALLKHNGIK